MYIIAIAWLYVVLLMALTEPSWVAGVATFFFYGVLPLSVLLYLLGTPQRRRNRLRRDTELERTKPSPARLDPDQ